MFNRFVLLLLLMQAAISAAAIFAADERPENKSIKSGKVTYVSAQFVYVQFTSTIGIEKGDTLYLKKAGKTVPALIAEHISKGSCAGTSIRGVSLRDNDVLVAFPAQGAALQDSLPVTLPDSSAVRSGQETSAAAAPLRATKKHRKDNSYSRTRLSVQSFSSTGNDKYVPEFQQWRYLLSTQFRNPSEMPVGFNAYATYRKRTGGSYRSSSSTDNWRVYNLSFDYFPGPRTQISLGRQLNNYTSSLGTFDGLLIQHDWGFMRSGVLAGSRPDFNQSYGLNFKLFETGVYFSRMDTVNKGYFENTLAFFEQTNSFKTDRRYLYFQHNSNPLENLQLFFTMEADLYKKQRGVAESILELNSLYLNSRYSLMHELSISFSYDNRKNILYYETYKSFIDSLKDNETRHGFRLSLDVRPARKLFLGISGGYNYKKGDIIPSRNLSLNFSYYDIPFLHLTPMVNVFAFKNSYISGNTFGGSLSRDLLDGNLSLTTGYKRLVYDFSSGNTQKQDILSADIMLRFLKNLYITAGYEGTFEGITTYNRILAELTARF